LAASGAEVGVIDHVIALVELLREQPETAGVLAISLDDAAEQLGRLIDGLQSYLGSGDPGEDGAFFYCRR
jgi:hypothetical protein